jgi:hypothetical protein
VRTGAACALIGLLSFGCPKNDEAPPGFDPNDPLIKKLQAEQERLAKAGPPKPKAAEPDPLAEIAAAPARPESLGIPSGVSADLGPVTLSLVEVLQSQRVGTDRVSLATTDRFLKVTLEAVSKEALELDLGTARLEREGQGVPLARDAQRAAKGSPLSTHLAKGASQDLVLYFEAPDEMIRKGLKIILTHGESRVELALQ